MNTSSTLSNNRNTKQNSELPNMNKSSTSNSPTETLVPNSEPQQISPKILKHHCRTHKQISTNILQVPSPPTPQRAFPVASPLACRVTSSSKPCVRSWARYRCATGHAASSHAAAKVVTSGAQPGAPGDGSMGGGSMVWSRRVS